MTRLIVTLLLAASLTFLPTTRAAAPKEAFGYWYAPSTSDVLIDGDEVPVTIRGVATWFDATRHGMSSAYVRAGIKYYIAAGPALRTFLGWKHWDDHFTVLVTSDLTGVQVVAEVVDWCSCHGTKGVNDDRLGDLSPALFKALGARLSRGVQFITIQVLP